LCDDAHELIDHILNSNTCAHEKVDLLGFSMGGMIAQLFILKYPSMVRKLILMGSAPGGGPHCPFVNKEVNKRFVELNSLVIQHHKNVEKRNAILGEIFQLMLSKDFADKDFVKQSVQVSGLYRRPAMVVAQQFVAMVQFDGKPHLSNLCTNMSKTSNNPEECLVLIIHGTSDNILDYRNSMFIHEKLGTNNCKLVLLTDEGHLMHYTKDGFSGIVNAIQSLDSSSAGNSEAYTLSEKKATQLLAKM